MNNNNNAKKMVKQNEKGDARQVKAQVEQKAEHNKKKPMEKPVQKKQEE